MEGLKKYNPQVVLHTHFCSRVKMSWHITEHIYPFRHYHIVSAMYSLKSISFDSKDWDNQEGRTNIPLKISFEMVKYEINSMTYPFS